MMHATGLARVSILFFGCALALSTGCTPPDITVPTEESGTSGDTEDSGGDGDGSPLQLLVNKDIDVLFVIDNSGSMADKQFRLAENFASFIEVLEDPEVDANYRIGITTTDNGNPWCPPGQTTPESGKLVASSCEERVADFEFNGEPAIAYEQCQAGCVLEPEQLQIQPTTTDYDPQPKARPWLERIEGQQNLPEGTSMAEAFECFAPQGISGCGFESPLESMYLALVRAENSDEESFGFLRANAQLAVILLTDEADCSYNKDWSEIFEADGNKVFWSDPTAAFPSSAVCWNAGVECFGGPDIYDGCEPANYDVNGNLGASDGDSVLHPMSRYVDWLAAVEGQKQQLDPNAEVTISLIAGVDSMGQPFYADVSDTDPEFQGTFGIGPGCEAPNPIEPGVIDQAVPPVRLRALVDEFSPGNMFSICQEDYSPALEALAQQIRAQIQPVCYSQCVADQDPATELVEPSCVIEQYVPGDVEGLVVPECPRDLDGAYLIDEGEGGYTMPSDGDDVCYAMLVDTQMLTVSPEDDMSEICADQGYNLELVIERRKGVPAPGGTAITGSCALAEFPGVECPGIGG